MKMYIDAYFGLLCYLAVVAGVALWFDLDLWALSLLYFGVPVLWFVTHERVAPKLLGIIGVFAVVSALLWESVGYTHGLWYELTVLPWRVFDIFPVEILLWNILFLYFLIFMYEYFQDDRSAMATLWRKRKVIIVTFIVMLLGLSLASIAIDTFVLPYGYSWLLAFTLSTAVVAGILIRTNIWSVLRKAFIFAILVLPIGLLYEYVSLVNVHWLFANPEQYIAQVSFLGHLVPLEEILFIALIPVWAVVVYELLLDDAT